MARPLRLAHLIGYAGHLIRLPAYALRALLRIEYAERQYVMSSAESQPDVGLRPLRHSIIVALQSILRRAFRFWMSPVCRTLRSSRCFVGGVVDELNYDVVVVGASLGGVAACFAFAVCMDVIVIEIDGEDMVAICASKAG